LGKDLECVGKSYYVGDTIGAGGGAEVQSESEERMGKVHGVDSSIDIKRSCPGSKRESIKSLCAEGYGV